MILQRKLHRLVWMATITSPSGRRAPAIADTHGEAERSVAALCVDAHAERNVILLGFRPPFFLFLVCCVGVMCVGSASRN